MKRIIPGETGRPIAGKQIMRMGIFLLLLTAALPATAAEKLNVVFILADDKN